jgi:hypothetical protein
MLIGVTISYVRISGAAIMLWMLQDVNVGRSAGRGYNLVHELGSFMGGDGSVKG